MSSTKAGLHLIVLALALSAVAVSACGDKSPAVFTHGVASGDVQPDGAVLWTRVDRETTLTLEIAADEAFTDIAVEEQVETSAALDFTVKVETSGLSPGADYFYRFRDGESEDASFSEIGVFRTAPPDDEAATVRFVFSGDTDGEALAGGIPAFDFGVLDAALAEDPDFFVYFGDTIRPYTSTDPEADALDGYRYGYRTTREAEPLRRILAGASIYTVWDGEELQDGAGGSGAASAGRQAFHEYMPIGGDAGEEAPYRRFRWGTAVELLILDERSFRDATVEEDCTANGQEDPDLLPGLGLPYSRDAYLDFREYIGLARDTSEDCTLALLDPSRTMLGAEQKEFLLEALEKSDATFKIVVNPVPIAELAILPYDRWEGYRAERDEILSFIAEEEIANVIFLTTDLHANVISDVSINMDSPSVAVEAITGPIANDTLADELAAEQRDDLAGAFEFLMARVSNVDCVEFDALSYGLVEVDPEAGTATITLKDESGRELCRTVVGADEDL